MAKRKDLEETNPDEGRLDESSSAESSSEDVLNTFLISRKPKARADHLPCDRTQIYSTSSSNGSTRNPNTTSTA